MRFGPLNFSYDGLQKHLQLQGKIANKNIWNPPMSMRVDHLEFKQFTISESFEN